MATTSLSADLDALEAADASRARWSLFVRKVLKTLWVLINLLVLIVLPIAAWDMYRHDMQPHFIAWFVSGVFVLLALPITFYEVAQHLENYRMPRLQRHVVRILLMVPIYAVDCWLALRFKDQTIYFDTIRECYEAYVIYNFYAYCVAYLQHRCVPSLEHALSRKPQQRHLFPVSLFAPPTPKMGEPFLRMCRHGVINYVVTRPLTTLLAFAAEAGDVYGDGQILNPAVAYPYLAFINNFSQAWAMYCLILFYKVTREELAPVRPFYKFLTVKAVVFLSFWQGQAILLGVKTNVIRVDGNDSEWTDYDAAETATGLQEFAICVEMFFAAIAHAYAFPVSEYDDEGGVVAGGGGGEGTKAPRRAFAENVADMFDLRDVVHDVVSFSRSNKDEFWAEVSFRYRTVIGWFTGVKPVRGGGMYAPVGESDEEGGKEGGGGFRRGGGGSRGNSLGSSPRAATTGVGSFARLSNGGTVGELPPGVAMRDMRGVSGGGFGSSPGATEATLAAVSSSVGAPGGDGGGERRANAGAAAATFSMPGVSALPGVETGGGGRAMAALEREGAVKESGRFTLE